MKLPTGAQMQRLDRSASEDFAVPSLLLMENAGLQTVLLMERELGPAGQSFAAIFVGPGNNGGDGLVIGRHLLQRGCQPLFFFLVPPDSLPADGATNLEIVRRLGLPVHLIDSSERVAEIPDLCNRSLSRNLPCYVVVDAIFGIGLCRSITGHIAEAIALINHPAFLRQTPVVAVDIPSGMEADSGRILGCCVQADHTATYGWAKPGHFQPGSGAWTGKVDIIDIGIPALTLQKVEVRTELADQELVTSLAQPLRRRGDAHKGTNGRLLLIAGSTGMTGAAILAARGALHAGVGLVSLAVPADLNHIFETTLPEVITVPLPASKGQCSDEDLEQILALADTCSAVVVGPGIGQALATAKLVLALYGQLRKPLLVDADALNILATCRDDLPDPAGPRLFTPHPGELSRLLAEPVEMVVENRLQAARRGQALFVATAQPTVLVLKGAGTVTVGTGGKTTINSTGNPGMAAAGMGDVLSGVIGALLCQGLAPQAAAVVGVYLHGAAADLLVGQQGVGYLAGEVAAALPQARKALLD